MTKNPYNYLKLKEAFDALNQPRLPASQIAEEVGKSEVFIWKVLNGEKWGTLETMYRIADCLGVRRVDLIIERENGKPRKNGKVKTQDAGIA